MAPRAGVLVELGKPGAVEVAGWQGAGNELLAVPGWVERRQFKIASPDDQLAPNLLPAQPYPGLVVYSISDLDSVELARKVSGFDEGNGTSGTKVALRSAVFELISDISTPATPPAGEQLPERPSVRCGPPAIVVIFSQPRTSEVEDEYNRWYDDIHAGETLMLPGFTRARRFRLAPPEDQFRRGELWSHQRYLTIYEVENVHLIAAARQAMAWFKQVSVEFASPALDVPPSCWTYELVNVGR